MKTENSGIVTSSLIKEFISKKYNIDVKNINEHCDSRENTVSYSFKTSNGGKYNIETTTTLDNDEVIAIVKKALKEDNLMVSQLSPKFEHVDGDSFEPLDYGYFQFVGISFTII